jgi:L-2-hydroxyglutarate oxidase LhgO
MFELDAQIHAIKQLKRDYNKIWDEVTWEFIVQHKSSFNMVFKTLSRASKKDKTDYIKRLYKRLNREKLLGKSLKNGFDSFLRKY